jgi:hypothetical protein
MSFEAVRMFLGVQGILYHGEGVKPTLVVSYSHKLYDGHTPEIDYGSPPTHCWFWRART